ncbi:hypothetical protein D3C81_1193810 [compost metagenome]
MVGYASGRFPGQLADAPHNLGRGAQRNSQNIRLYRPRSQLAASHVGSACDDWCSLGNTSQPGRLRPHASGNIGGSVKDGEAAGRESQLGDQLRIPCLAARIEQQAVAGVGIIGGYGTREQQADIIFGKKDRPRPFKRLRMMALDP